MPGPSHTASPTAIPTLEGVLAVVRALLTEIVGEDYLLDLEIDMDTSFSDDLEVESLEFVALAEKLTDHYGEGIDFVAWLADMELDDIIGMSVGSVVHFVHRSLAEPADV